MEAVPLAVSGQRPLEVELTSFGPSRQLAHRTALVDNAFSTISYMMAHSPFGQEISGVVHIRKILMKYKTDNCVGTGKSIEDATRANYRKTWAGEGKGPWSESYLSCILY